MAHFCTMITVSLNDPRHLGALLAVLWGEVERERFAQLIREVDVLFRRTSIIIEPVTIEQGHLARQAFLEFGKGRHKAGLNFGDCFAYALAKSAGKPLLFKGDDFGQTDIKSAT